MTTLTSLFRIGGEGRASARPTATDADGRLALVDRELDRVAAQGGVLILEIDRDGDSFARLDRFRHGGADACEPPYDQSTIDFLRVGVAGAVGAAEYWGNDGILATHNPRPSEADRHRVLYDTCVPLHFPPETVVPLAEIRQLMRDYALSGEWSPAVPNRAHDDLVA